jgi:hypothetical protein
MQTRTDTCVHSHTSYSMCTVYREALLTDAVQYNVLHA